MTPSTQIEGVTRSVEGSVLPSLLGVLDSVGSEA